MKDKELSFDEKLEIMQKLGLPKKWAKYQTELWEKPGKDVWAVLPSFRFLKPISDRLEFHRGGFAEMVRLFIKQGVLEDRLPEVAALIKEGASVESIEKFAFERIQEATECILYQLGDQESAECADVFDEPDFSQMNRLRLMEVEPDGTPTGRYAIELHGIIPFSDIED